MAVVIGGTLSPAWWDSAAIVSSFHHILQSPQGIPLACPLPSRSGRCQPLVRDLLVPFAPSSLAGVCRLQAVEQRDAYRSYRASSVSFSWPDFFRRRLVSWIALSNDNSCDIGQYNVGALVANLRNTPSHIGVSFINTIANSWATTHRLHETNRLACVFDCRDIDSLNHYVQCPALVSAIAVALSDPLPIPPPTLSLSLPSPLDRKKDILRLFLAYHTYHSSRHSLFRRALGRNNREIFVSAVRHAVAARHKASNMTCEVRAQLSSPHLATVSNTRLGPHANIDVSACPSAATISNTRFVQGGDHFMTTSFTSAATAATV